MAKHPKSSKAPISGSSKQTTGKARPAPYKRPTVEVKFEGVQHVVDKGKGKASAPSRPVSTPSAASVASTSKPQASALPSQVPSNGSTASPGTFVIIAGSYEKLLYGIEGSYPAGQEKPVLKPIFIFPAHLACVKAVAASPGGKWLATGSEDEFVKVWDLRRRKEVGSLSQHTGSITSVHFPSSSHLITTSEDSTLSLFRTSDWALLKSLKGHSGRVNHVDVHPTGRVALTVGKDKTLKMWDLMRGRGASSLPLDTEAELVKFSPKGTHFAVLYPKKIEIYSLTLKLLHTLKSESRFNTLLFATIPSVGDSEEAEEEEEDVELLCVGTEKGVVDVYTLEIGTSEDESEDEEDEDEDEMDGDGPKAQGGKSDSKSEGSGADVVRIGSLTGHTNRVKAISSLSFDKPDSTTPSILLSSVSSDGFINLYDVSELYASAVQAKGEKVIEGLPIGSYDTKGSRLTVCYLAEGRAAGSAVKTEIKEERESVIGVDDDDEDESGDEVDMYDDEEEEDDGIEVELEDEEEEDEDEEEDEEE